MDFFEYASFAGMFTNEFWVQFLVGGLCFAIVFIFQAIALYTIATNNGYGNKWMAFIPFVNAYYIGVCAQKNKFYKVDTKTIGIAAAVFEFVLFAAYIIYYVACFSVIDYEQANYLGTVLGQAEYEYYLEGVPKNLAWAEWMYNYMSYILNVIELLYLVLQVCLLICFFQTYACRRYLLFAITSVLFPIQGILFFAVRNNKGMNYREYVRAQQARQYAAYQQYQQQQFNQNPYNRNPYNQNPYNQNPYNNPYNNQNGSTSQTKPDDPFADLGGSDSGNSSNNNGGSPFDDFN